MLPSLIPTLLSRLWGAAGPFFSRFFPTAFYLFPPHSAPPGPPLHLVRVFSSSDTAPDLMCPPTVLLWGTCFGSVPARFRIPAWPPLQTSALCLSAIYPRAPLALLRSCAPLPFSASHVLPASICVCPAWAGPLAGTQMHLHSRLCSCMHHGSACVLLRSAPQGLGSRLSRPYILTLCTAHVPLGLAFRPRAPHLHSGHTPPTLPPPCCLVLALPVRRSPSPCALAPPGLRARAARSPVCPTHSSRLQSYLHCAAPRGSEPCLHRRCG
jgi:hypothetical protein